MATPPNMLNKVRLVQGQTKVLKLTVKTCEGAPATLTGATIYFTARENATSSVLISKISPDGIEINDASKGIVTITLSSEDTNIPKGCYYYDVWVVFSGTPPIRHPVVKMAELIVESSMTSFS